MKLAKRWALTAAVMTALMILGLQAMAPARAVAKTRISDEDKKITLTYSKYIDSRYMPDACEPLSRIVENPKKKATYSAVVKNKKIAAVVNSPVKSIYGKKLVVSKSIGKTSAVIYEKKKGARKKTKIGTITIKVKQAKMTDVADAAVYFNDKGPSSIWLKLNLGDKKKTMDYGTVLYEEIMHNASIGTRINKTDYKAEYTLTGAPEDTDPKIINEYAEDGSTIVDLTEDGVLTAKASGKTNLNVKITFSDDSVFEQNLDVIVTGDSLADEDKYDISNIRDIIVGLDAPVKLADGTEKPMINFDNAATTPAFRDVMEEVDEKLEMYGSIGRGSSQKSNYSTELYLHTRDKVLDFVSADPEIYTCFYVNNTTDGLNKLASALVKSKKDIVLATRMEHHANDLSWRERCKVVYAEVEKDGRISYGNIEKMLKKYKGKIKYVTVTAASNVTGYVTDVHRVARLAHKYGAKIIVDGAQIVAHRKFSMQGETDDADIDFFVFSAHKMYSPYGGGAVVGPSKILNKRMPTFYGGGTVTVVGDYWQHYKEAPARYEAGSPNYPGVVGLGKALDILNDVGFDAISAHEKALNTKLIAGIKQYDNAIIYGDSENIDDRVGVVTFNFTDINSKLVADKLSELGAVATRRGAFCAHPYVWRLMDIPDSMVESFESCTDAKTPGMIRVSFGIYNTEEEVDQFLEVLPKAMEAARAQQEDPDEDVVPEY
ncbi:MAG: aminotransferase class V-fold PLP-dependent enzyme [Eubacterium sp.]|nr:aminotransferase class V-fold PLP-dependent enzyme [Eubacterium sp.]